MSQQREKDSKKYFKKRREKKNVKKLRNAWKLNEISKRQREMKKRICQIDRNKSLNSDSTRNKQKE